MVVEAGRAVEDDHSMARADLANVELGAFYRDVATSSNRPTEVAGNGVLGQIARATHRPSDSSTLSGKSNVADR